MTYTKRLKYFAKSYHELAQIYRKKNKPKEAKKWHNKFLLTKEKLNSKERQLPASKEAGMKA